MKAFIRVFPIQTANIFDYIVFYQKQKLNIIQLKTLPVKRLDVRVFDNANDFEVFNTKYA